MGKKREGRGKERGLVRIFKLPQFSRPSAACAALSASECSAHHMNYNTTQYIGTTWQNYWGEGQIRIQCIVDPNHFSKNSMVLP